MGRLQAAGQAGRGYHPEGGTTAVPLPKDVALSRLQGMGWWPGHRNWCSAQPTPL
jgi:hypothetical protein